MRKQKDGGTGNASLTVKVESEAGYVELNAHMLAGQVFYILDRDLSEILKENKNAIWGNLLKKKGSDTSRGDSIREILKAPDQIRKYPAALICTADKTSRIYSPINVCYTRAIDVLSAQAVRFFIIDSDGKAAIGDLKPGTCYVCGIGKTKKKSGVWNVQVELKPGKIIYGWTAGT
ncbi:MAG TPA: hypothetical protein VGO50_16910 [Pyrinomonadaceae bacterium]|jgi:hypothetical protein|nr:hypothetical protein [Pyrinomonadaceae bacterium]